MSNGYQQQQRPQGQSRERQQGDPEFNRLMKGSVRLTGLRECVDKAATAIEEMLPDFMKGQGERCMRRALITFAKNPDLLDCPDEDYRRCVVEAAEMGFAIDGKLAYVVKYKSSFQLQLDYKAVVAVMKRCRTIKDIQADIICANDTFRHGRNGGVNILEHTFVLGQKRGDVIGAYARVWLPDGSWNYALMDRQELDAIQARAPSKKGPWSTDVNEMRKKTVIHRVSKMYRDDPGLMRMLEITDYEDDHVDNAPAPPRTIADLSAAFAGQAQIPAAEQPFDPPLTPAEPYADTPEPITVAERWAEIEGTFDACLNASQVSDWAKKCREENPEEGDLADIQRLAEKANQRLMSAAIGKKTKSLLP